MGRYVALAPVFDSATGRTYMPGHAFEMDGARAAALVPGFAEPAQGAPAAGPAAPEPEPGPEDAPVPDMAALYASMTNAQLADIAASRGLDVPKRATKAELIDVLAGR